MSDPDVEHDGKEDEQTAGDVPMLSTHSYKHNIFNDQRRMLEVTNLTSLFEGKRIVSANTGNIHSRSRIVPEKSGKPVARICHSAVSAERRSL
ncbi:hypothetical protein [Novosphingobium sp. 9U]|uniref:hypothetical protein n=1 Tax=Novosphingobium sp. 9U TaxID=2653158 RepID=UPI0012F1BE78|nr:hypothetical protein [Novosphingobium sp. 9U]VWX49732.1 hypothetical protein NOVOSPHI9U_260012 [Novosphingobium sp. 9U]